MAELAKKFGIGLFYSFNKIEDKKIDAILVQYPLKLTVQTVETIIASGKLIILLLLLLLIIKNTFIKHFMNTPICTVQKIVKLLKQSNNYKKSKTTLIKKQVYPRKYEQV